MTQTSVSSSDDDAAKVGSHALGRWLAVLSLAARTIGGWIAYRRRRNRLWVRLGRLAAGPVLLLIIGIAFIYLGRGA